MKTIDLIKRLKDSGTGQGKLQAATDWLEDNPDASPDDLMAAMVADGSWPDGTVAKANRFMGNEDPIIKRNSAGPDGSGDALGFDLSDHRDPDAPLPPAKIKKTKKKKTTKRSKKK